MKDRHQPMIEQPADAPTLHSVQLCSTCGHNTLVIDSRAGHVGSVQSIRRRRECAHCARRFTTVEIPVNGSKTHALLRMALSQTLRARVCDAMTALAALERELG